MITYSILNFSCVHILIFNHFLIVEKMSKISQDEGNECLVKRKVERSELDNPHSHLDILHIKSLKRQFERDAPPESQTHETQRQGIDSSLGPKGKAVHTSSAEGSIHLPREGTSQLSPLCGTNFTSTPSSLLVLSFHFLRTSHVLTRLSIISHPSRCMISRRIF